MSIFAQMEDSREPYLITETLCSVCSSFRSRSNLSYFAGDRSQSVLQTETMRSLTQVFYYFTEPFYEALSSKVQSLFQGTFLHYVTVQSTHWGLWSLSKSWLWPFEMLYLCFLYLRLKKERKKNQAAPICVQGFIILAVSHLPLFMALKRSDGAHRKCL